MAQLLLQADLRLSFLQAILRSSSAVGALAAACSLATVGSAEAQSAGESTPSVRTSDQLEEIVVTAQKRVERIQDVPIAVSALTSNDVEKLNLQNVDDLNARFPNFEILLPSGPAAPQFSVRGVTETDYSPNQSSPIAMYVDGVFKSVGAVQALQTFDLDRIEVLRGPQGTLQGRNSTGGAVQFYSTPPGFDEGGYLMVGAGDYGRYETQGAVQAPLVDEILAARAAFTFTNVDGYIHNAVPNAPYGGNLSGVFDWAGRLSFLFKPSDDFQAILRLSASRSDPVNYGAYALNIQPGGVGIPAGTFPGVFPTGYTRAGLGFFDSQVEYARRREIKNRGFSLDMEYQLRDDLKLTSITGYDMGLWNSPENDSGTPFQVEDATYHSKIHSEQQELRLTSSFAGPYQFIFGALYDQESEYISTINNVTQYQPAIITVNGQQENICILTQYFSCIQTQQWNQKRVDYAVYLNNTYKITEDLVASAGARYTDDSIGEQGFRTGIDWLNPATGQPVQPGINLIPGVQNDPAAVAPNLSTSDHKWIGHIGLDYHLDPDHMVYTSFSRGFRGSAYNAGAFSATSSINAVKPETLNDYEVGSKNEFFDRRLKINLSGFYYIYRNQQFASIDPSTGFSTEYNLPKVNSMGGELELEAKPVHDLTLNFGSGYTFAIYRSGLVNLQDVSGDRVEESPRWSFNASVDWRAYTADWGDVDLYLDANGVTKQYFSPSEAVADQENGYSVYNASITVETPDEDKQVTFWLHNILDRKYFTAIVDESSVNYIWALRGNPRSFGVQGRIRF